MRFFDGGGHLIFTQLREYSRPKAVVVLAPIRSRCGGAVGCRSRGGLAVKCSYLARPARGAGEIPEALPGAKVPHGHDTSSAARLHAIGQAKIDGPLGPPVWPAPAIFGVDLGQESTKQKRQAANARNVASWTTGAGKVVNTRRRLAHAIGTDPQPPAALAALPSRTHRPPGR